MRKMKTRVWTVMGKWNQHITGALKNEDGITTVEVVLLILVAVGLVLIFKNQITSLVTSIFSKITSQAGKI